MSPLPAPTPHADLPVLRRELETLGYTAAEVGRLLGMRDNDSQLDYVSSASFPMLIVEPRPPSPGTLLAHLFLAGGTVAVDQLEPIFSPRAWRALVECGLVAVERGQVRAAAVLLPWKKLWIACGRREERFDEDYVFFPDRSTVVAAGYLTAAPDEPRARAVDVGTGSGILALLLAHRHGFAQVRGYDVNPRALAFARFNAALNGVPLELAPVGPDPWPAFGEPPGSVDLLVFVLPQLYTVPIGRAIASHVPDGERLLLATYGRIREALSPGGRAVLYHQSLRAPGHDLPALLERAALPGLHVTWRPTPAPYPESAEFGVALVRRRRGDEPPFVRVALPGRGLVLRREAIAEHFAALALAQGDGFAETVPTLIDGPARVMLRVQGERLGDTGRMELGGVVLPTTLLPLLGCCDGARTIGEIAAVQPSPELARQTLRALVEHGVLGLRARPG